MIIIGYIVMIFFSSFLISIGYKLTDDYFEGWEFIFPALFWPVGLPMFGGYFVAMWIIGKYT